MHADSFDFGPRDMYEEFGLMIVKYDVLSPALRRSSVTIPGRSGVYDFGGSVYEERTLRMDCDTFMRLGRSGLRELSYALSKKDRIRLWDEPDKYYVGRLYNATEIAELCEDGRSFTLEFTCEPFAYGTTCEQTFSSHAFRPGYRGTAAAGARVIIRNTGTEPLTGVRIRVREIRDAY